MSEDTIPGQLDTISAQFAASAERMRRIEDGQVSQDRRLTKMQGELTENTDATARIEKNTKELVEFFDAMQGAFKVFNWFGKLAKPIGYVAAAVAAVAGAWATLRGHK